MEQRELRINEMSDDELIRNVRAAEIVFGFDVSRNSRHLFYGRDALERIVKNDTAEDLKVVVFTFDGHTDEMERLCAACQVVKGKDDYGDGDPYLPSVN